MSVTRNDDRTNRSICRGEFLEIILRLAHIQYRKEAEAIFMAPVKLKRKESMRNSSNGSALNHSRTSRNKNELGIS